MKRVAAALRRRDFVRLGFGAARIITAGVARRIERGAMSDEIGRRPSTLGLVGDAISQASMLVSSELVLAKTEFGEKLAAAVAAVISTVGAAVFLLVAMIFLLQGLVFWLIEGGWRGSVASLLVGVSILVAAVGAILIAKKWLTVDGLKPTRTIRQAAKAAEAVRGRTS